MKTTMKTSDHLYDYLAKTGAHFVVDKNPSEDKIQRIKEAIKRKNDLFNRALDKFKNSSSISVIE